MFYVLVSVVSPFSGEMLQVKIPSLHVHNSDTTLCLCLEIKFRSDITGSNSLLLAVNLCTTIIMKTEFIRCSMENLEKVK